MSIIEWSEINIYKVTARIRKKKSLKSIHAPRSVRINLLWNFTSSLFVSSKDSVYEIKNCINRKKKKWLFLIYLLLIPTHNSSYYKCCNCIYLKINQILYSINCRWGRATDIKERQNKTCKKATCIRKSSFRSRAKSATWWSWSTSTTNSKKSSVSKSIGEGISRAWKVNPGTSRKRLSYIR